MCAYHILTRTIKFFPCLTAFLPLPGTVQIWIILACHSGNIYSKAATLWTLNLGVATTKTKPLPFLGLQKLGVTG